MPEQLTAGDRFTAEQAAAIARRHGDLLLDAGAGSGKTSVLVERFVRAVLQDGAEVGQILTITFTEKAAAELRDRIRTRLRELGADEHAQATESAYISTIHGFCARVLRAQALRAGLDPAFVVLDQPDADRLAEGAFDAALETLAATAPGGVELVSAYGVPALREAITSVHAELRSRGQLRPHLPPLPAAVEAAAARRELLAAAARAAAELAAVDNPGARVTQALERLEEVDTLCALEDPWPGELDRIALPRGNGAALATEACVAYAEALAVLRRVCEHRRAGVTHGLLGALLDGYGERYAAAKRDAGAVDFEDLELLARELLAEPEISRRYRERFTHVMVDEMQDTNRVQLELIELVADGNLFTVGDAQQSIYAFRHADVELFERRGEQLQRLGARATLQTNFRSRPQILAALNDAFARVLGERFRPLRAGRGAEGETGEPLVELLIADKGADWSSDGLAAPWRLAEARALARRVAQLVADGVAPGEIVVLTRATTDLRAYERALESEGVPTYVIGGRGYWAHPQVIDCVAYLAALANPRDEMALLTVLGSPLVGASLDALVVLGAVARAAGRDPWSVLHAADAEESLAELSADERHRLTEFAGWFGAERRVVARTGAAELIERGLQRTGYDLTVLALPGGERRLANVRKLMRLAHEHELEHGPDLRGFLELAARRAGGVGGEASRESEAPVESEGLHAVRLMTIHRAKGLEFPVVCVADLGRAPIRWPPLMRIGADGRFGLRLSEPGTGKAEPALDYAALSDAQLLADQAEERRLFYVAMTRARERLILSGAARLSAIAAGQTPIAWIAPAFIPEIAGLTEGQAGVGEGGVAFRFVRPEDEGEVAGATSLGESPRGRSSTVDEGTPAALAPTAPAPEPRLPVTRLSYSSLAEYARCGYRFYAERVLGLPPAPALPPLPGSSVAEGGGMPAGQRGTLIHALLERLDFRAPRLPDAGAVIATAVGERPGAQEAERIATLIAAFAASDLCARLAAAGSALREERFAFALDGDVLVTGTVDVVARERAGAWLIVDYKSDALAGREPDAIVEDAYAAQRAIYALAALRAGAASVDVAHVFLERPQEPALATFTAADSEGLESGLRALARGVLEREFAVSEQPRRGLCDGCPAESGLCSWPAAMTRRESVDRLF
jgi:ATP-dependent exoDNAse (exonuclease V) beta subunit